MSYRYELRSPIKLPFRRGTAPVRIGKRLHYGPVAYLVQYTGKLVVKLSYTIDELGSADLARAQQQFDFTCDFHGLAVTGLCLLSTRSVILHGRKPHSTK
jgi:hypothetical protein